MKSKGKRKYSIVQIYNLKVRKILFVFMIFPIFHYISFSFFVSFPLFVPSSKKSEPGRGGGGRGEHRYSHLHTSQTTYVKPSYNQETQILDLFSMFTCKLSFDSCALDSKMEIKVSD